MLLTSCAEALKLENGLPATPRDEQKVLDFFDDPSAYGNLAVQAKNPLPNNGRCPPPSLSKPTVRGMLLGPEAPDWGRHIGATSLRRHMNVVSESQLTHPKSVPYWPPNSGYFGSF